MSFKPTHILTNEFGYSLQVELAPWGGLFTEDDRQHQLPASYCLIDGEVHCFSKVGSPFKVRATAWLIDSSH